MEKDPPSGILITVHPFKNPIVIACNASKLLPLPFSPINTLLTVLLSLSTVSIILPNSTVSSRTSIAGFRKNPHACVVLKASTALN